MHKPEPTVYESDASNQELSAAIESGASELSTMLDELWSTSTAVVASNISSERDFDSNGERIPDVTSLTLYIEDGSSVEVARHNVSDGSQQLSISFNTPRIQQTPTERGYSTELVRDTSTVTCSMSDGRWAIVEDSGFGQNDASSTEQRFVDSVAIVQREIGRREPIDRKTSEGSAKYLSRKSPIDLAYDKSLKELYDQSGILVERPLTKDEERAHRSEAKRLAKLERKERRRRARDTKEEFLNSPEGRQQSRENASVARGFIFSPLVGLNRAVKVRRDREGRDTR